MGISVSSAEDDLDLLGDAEEEGKKAPAGLPEPWGAYLF